MHSALTAERARTRRAERLREAAEERLWKGTSSEAGAEPRLSSRRYPSVGAPRLGS
jgi:hypothetical protein